MFHFKKSPHPIPCQTNLKIDSDFCCLEDFRVTLNCSCKNSLSMLLLYKVLRVVKHKLDHIMICSKYDYSFETLIL